MFKIGNIVEITKESSATGMLDFVDGKGYKVEAVSYEEEFTDDLWLRKKNYIFLKDESGRTEMYDARHFKLKEDIEVEKKECLFKEGQVVWDLIYGKGEVSNVDFLNFPLYPVCVKFDQSLAYGPVLRSYTAEGTSSEFGIRSLYFSEPKIEAATEPVFEPTLKEGDIIVVKHVKQDWKHLLQVHYEDEDAVWVNGEDDGYLKSAWNFYKLGEKIEFR